MSDTTTTARFGSHSDDNVALPLMRHTPHDQPDRYDPDSSLVEAIKVALILGQPLLVTGEPGTGKTQMAAYVAHALNDPASPIFQQTATRTYPRPLVFETKSTSTSRDLFYTYDMVGRFHAAQTGKGSQESVDYLNYNAFGVAVLHSLEKSRIEQCVPRSFSYVGRQRFVVLVDEIDKAPRDFPNDILNEIEGMYFRVPELENKAFQADALYRPVLILTSNSERNLPDAFLRRCIYYDIPFPDRERLIRILRLRLPSITAATVAGDVASASGSGTTSAFATTAVDLFLALREPAAALNKKPATAELIGWLKACMARGADIAHPASSRHNREIVRTSLCALIKTGDDQKKGVQVMERWLAGTGIQRGTSS